MKYTALIATVLVLFFMACTSVQPPAAQPAAPAAPTPAVPAPAPTAQPEPVAQPTAPPADIPPGPKPVEAKPMPAVTKELQDLLSRADQKLKSYKYLELILPDKKQPDTISVKGTKIKIRLYEYDPYFPEKYMDTVYMDTATKTIVGRCESRQRCIWTRGDNTKKEWTDLNYDQHRRKTPYEWLKDVPATARILGPEVHESRATTKIEYDDAGKLVTMWIDDSYGIPVEVWVTPSSGETVEYLFNDLQFNTLLDKDVMPLSVT